MKVTEGTAGEGHNITHMEISESRFRRRGQAVGWRLPSSTCSMELLPLHLKNAFQVSQYLHISNIYAVMKRIKARLDQNSCESFLFILYKHKDLEMSRMQQHDLIWQAADEVDSGKDQVAAAA